MSVEDNKMEGDTEVDGEEQEPMDTGREASPESYKDKYRELKSKLKYLFYEHECFEVEVQRAQAKLLELSHDKSYLLDQLMRYEPVLLSDEEDRDELTDLSVSEDDQLYPHYRTQPSPFTVPTVKSTGTPTPSSTPLSTNTAPQTNSRPSEPSRQAISKAANIKKRQAKSKAGSSVKIAKTVTRTRQTNVSKHSRVQSNAQRRSPVSLVVSLPRSTPASVQSTTQEVVTLKPHPLPDGSHDHQPQVTNHTLLPSLPPPLTSSHVTLPTATLGTLPSSSSSSSSSSSDSDSDDSTSSSSETRNDQSGDRETRSPVQMVAEAKSSSALLRPKAITSPVKSAPPANIEMGVSTPPPLLSPLLSPTGTQVGWTKHPTSPHGSFIIPSLTSPPGSLPFSSLGKAHKSAFQLVSPRGAGSIVDHTHHMNIDGQNSDEHMQ